MRAKVVSDELHLHKSRGSTDRSREPVRHQSGGELFDSRIKNEDISASPFWEKCAVSKRFISFSLCAAEFGFTFEDNIEIFQVDL